MLPGKASAPSEVLTTAEEPAPLRPWGLCLSGALGQCCRPFFAFCLLTGGGTIDTDDVSLHPQGVFFHDAGPPDGGTIDTDDVSLRPCCFSLLRAAGRLGRKNYRH